MPSKGSSALPIGALLLALGAGCGTPKPTSLATESHMEVMPELSGTDHRGQPYSLREDLGRGPTLVIFYRGHWWGYCKHQLGELAKQEKAFGARGVNIVAISADEQSDAAAMAKRYGIWFPLLSDEDSSMAKKYAGLGPNGFARPSIYLLDSEGRVLYRRIGENKADRPTAERLLTIIDEKLALQDMPAAAAFEFPTRAQVAANLGASRVDGETDFLGAVDVAMLRALGSRFEIGLEAGVAALPELEARGALLLRLRHPYVRGLAELYAQVPVGITTGFGDDGAPLRMRTGLSLGNKARLTPESYVFAELGAELLEPIEDEVPGALQGMLRLGYGWAW